MQYQSAMSREELEDLALNQYFANVDAKDLDAVLDCFHDSAMLTVQTAFAIHSGKDNIRRMFIDFMDSFKTIVHKDFTTTIDTKNSRISACFTAELEEPEGNIIVLQNTNFWRIREGKFQEVYVYMSGSNPLV